MLRMLVSRFLWICLCVILIPSVCPAREQAEEEAAGVFSFVPDSSDDTSQVQRVRIGLLEQYGFFHSRDNALRGYMPALFEGLKHLAGWKVEWVAIRPDDVAEALEKGRVDLVCGIIWTPERARIMQYSNVRAGMYATTLHVAEDKPVHYMEVEDFEGLRIGFLKDSQLFKIFEKQARNYGFSFVPVVYLDSEVLQKDFKAGKIDAYVDGNLFGEGKIAGVFDMRPFYFVSALDDKRFMPHINRVLTNLQLLTPQQAVANFANQYVDICKNVSIALSHEEEHWLDSKPVLRVALSEFEESTTRRRYDLFLIRFVERLAEYIGVRLEYVTAPDYDACLALLREGKADISTNVFPSRQFRNAYSIDSGLPYYSPLIELAVRKAVEPGSGLRVGVLSEMSGVRAAYSFIYPRDVMHAFSSIQECRKALQRGEIDAYVPFYPGVPHSKRRDGEIRYQSTQALYPMALGFGQHLPPVVQSVFGKAIAGFSTAEVESLLLEVPPLEGLPLLSYLVEQYYGLLIITGGLVCLIWAWRARHEVLRLRRVAYTDTVTQGRNLTFFLQQADKSLREDASHGYIISANIRQLGQINQLYGYDKGDKAIRACHAALSTRSGADELVAHSGRGRFLCLWHCASDDEVEDRLQGVFRQFAQFGEELGHIVILSAGIVRVTAELGDVPRLVEAAETAKNLIGDITYKSHYAYYNPEIEQERLLICHIENRMEDALEKGEFQVFVQPQVELTSGQMSGGEVLVRWRTATGNFVSPAFFIPIFERNGFVRSLDFHMLEQVCCWLRSRLDAGHKVLPLSINQSRSLFLSQNYCDNFLAVLKNYGVPAHLVTVEITESMADCNMTKLQSNLQLLRDNKISIALDDFGKGYSSLSTLMDFPIDIIKLDKDFLTNERYESLLTPLVQLSRNLGLKVLCEGIETREQFERLRMLGCAYGQGFYMARPMPLAQYAALLDQNRIFCAAQ